LLADFASGTPHCAAGLLEHGPCCGAQRRIGSKKWRTLREPSCLVAKSHLVGLRLC